MCPFFKENKVLFLPKSLYRWKLLFDEGWQGSSLIIKNVFHVFYSQRWYDKTL